MASHEPFGYLQHKLWSKEGPGVKLAVWLSTTKSWELTRPRCVQMECDIPLESYWGKLQVFFRSHPNQRSGSYELPKSWESKPGQFQDFSLGVPLTKSQLDAGAAEQHREYYMGEGGGFLRVQAVVNQMSPCCPWLVPTPRVIPNVN